ncbi:MAG: hypothetical protein A2033_04345 [Bacteroidetes bacterium GWA2_31_9]|nr:MAG: hypothetical protein A2033_04345 [Bacteroidetes bacterium GWA2_31_9]
MKSTIILLIFSIAIFSFSTINAQDKSYTLDSLWNELGKAKHDTARAELFIEIGDFYENQIPDSAIYFYEKALNIAENKNTTKYQSLKSTSLLYIGIIYRSRGSFKLALDYFQMSLKIASEIKDSKKIMICYNNIGILYNIQSDYNFAFEYYQKALKIATNNNYKKEIADYNGNIGIIYWNNGKYQNALNCFFTSIKTYFELLKECNDKNKHVELKYAISSCYICIGNIYGEQSDFKNSQENYFKSLHIFEELNDKYNISKCYNNIALNYSNQGYFDKSIEYYLKSIKIKTDLADKDGIGWTLNNIGEVHRKQKNYNKALEYYNNSYNIFNEIEDKKGIAANLNNIGLLKFETKSIDSALFYVKKALLISEEANLKKLISQCYTNLGSIYSTLSNYDIGIEYYFKSYKIAEELKDGEAIATVLYELGNLYIKKSVSVTSKIDKINLLKLSDEYISKSINVAKELNLKLIVNGSALQLFRINKELNNFEKALNYADLFIITKDSMFNEEKTRAIADMETKYETEKKDLEINNQKLTIEKNEKLLRQTIIIIALIALFLLTAIILWLRTRAKNIQLVKQNLDIVKCQKIHKSEVVKKEIQPQLSQSIYDKLLVKFEEEKIYTKTDLTLDNLAEILQTNRTYLSQVINEQFNVNFSTLLNKYRVNEARNILSDKNSDVPIKLLYMQLGFNSMATFYEAFKKHTGITPSFFRKQAVKEI